MKNLVKSQTAARLSKFEAELQSAVLKPGARKRKDSVAIHDLRVSIRRLTEALRAFEAWFEPERVAKIRASLRKLMDRCAAVRNCDIAVQVLRAAGWQDAELFAGLEEERRHTREELARKLESWRKKDRVRKWRGRLVARRLAGSPESGGSAREHASRLLPAMIQDLFRSGQEAARPDSSHQVVHQFRLKTKRMRYTLELFTPVYGSKTKPVLEWLKGLQEKLGAINDCATTLEMIRRDRSAAAAVRRLTDEREAEFRKHWKEHFGPRERVRWKAVLGAADGNK